MKLSLVIPCFNEQDNVRAFFDETQRAFNSKRFDYEFVFVNDGSRDNTLKNLLDLYESERFSNIQVVDLSRNFGKESAMYAGLQNARGDMVCIIDADLQQRPEVVLEMMDVLDNEPDVDCVAAFQDKRKESKVLTFLKSSFYSIINKLSDVHFENAASDFRLFRRNVLEALLNMTESQRFSKGLFSWVGFNTKYIPYTVMERNAGESKWSVKKLFKYALDGITAFTGAPLKLPFLLSGVSAVSAVLFLIIYAIYSASAGTGFHSWAIILTFIMLASSVQLFCMGIIGMYLSSVFFQSKNRPIVIVKKVYK